MNQMHRLTAAVVAGLTALLAVTWPQDSGIGPTIAAVSAWTVSGGYHLTGTISAGRATASR
jgi:hypothetical protein